MDTNGGDRRRSEVSEATLAIGIEPPGNVLRDIALYKRRIFGLTGDPTALAFPDALFLAFGSKPPRHSFPGIKSRRKLSRDLAEAWREIDAEAAFGGLAPSADAGSRLRPTAGGLFLALAGPLEELARGARRVFEDNGIGPSADPHFPECPGIFLSAADTEAHREAALRAGPPEIKFRDCALVLWSIAFSSGGTAASCWRELARAHRPSIRSRRIRSRPDSGPPPSP